MSKFKRQAKIVEILKKNVFETQKALILELKKAGFEVTQSTISRDIKELGLLKELNSSGESGYKLNDDEDIFSRRLALFKESVISINSSENIIVIKTIAGAANSAAAMIDTLEEPLILGSVAGDDTIFIVVSEKSKVNEVIDLFISFM